MKKLTQKQQDLRRLKATIILDQRLAVAEKKYQRERNKAYILYGKEK